MRDDRLREWLGPEASEALHRWSEQYGYEHSLRSVFDNGGTAAKIGIVDRRDRGRSRSTRLVLKLDTYSGADFGMTEFARHHRAFVADGEWARAHLAGQEDSPIAVGDRASLVFQSIAGELDWFTPLSTLLRGFHGHDEQRCSAEVLAEVFAAVIHGVLADWAGDPDVEYTTVPGALRLHFDYRLDAGRPLARMLADGRERSLVLLRDPGLTEGIELTVPVGKAHGDLHVENALVRARPEADPGDYRLIDLANHQERGPLARDPAHLLMHMINLSLPYLDGGAKAALAEVLITPGSRRADVLPRWLPLVISSVYDAGERWIADTGFGADWRRDRPLSLYAATLMILARRSTRAEDRPWLDGFAVKAADAFLAPASGPRPRTVPRPSAASAAMTGTGTGKERYFVGREAETQAFEGLLRAPDELVVLNIFGPGGIGKTEVRKEIARRARAAGATIGEADISVHGGSVAAVLRALASGLVPAVPLESLTRFTAELDARDAVREVTDALGGVETLYGPLGELRHETALREALDATSVPLTTAANTALRNRLSFERFLRNGDQDATQAFAELLRTGPAGSTALLLDTYEEVGGLDKWVRRTLIPALPRGVRLVLLGRNHLPEQSMEWDDPGVGMTHLRLPELAEQDAKQYLRHFGLTDAASLDRVYGFTGGYPLILMLVRDLAQRHGGWEAVRDMEYSADRDVVAGRLLERILREESAQEVSEVLEKCAVASWFNPEIIMRLLGVGSDQARDLFEKVRRHSFVERHPEGVRHLDKIRDLLVERLRYTSEAEYERLRAQLLAYHADKARGLAAEAG